MTEILAPLILGAVIGFALGFMVAWVRSSKAATEQRVALETQLAQTAAERDAAKRNSDAQLKLMEDARARLEGTFKALASDALRANSEMFIHQARAQMELLFKQADGNLEKRREAIEGLLRPMSDSLKRYEQQVREIEGARKEAYGGLQNQVASLMKETANLVNALRQPHVRGRWGELTLKRAVELAGLAEHCDFSEQVSLKTDEGSIRPDMIVHLPADREIVVDAKVPLDAYLAAAESADEEARDRNMRRHAHQVRAHMGRLASRDYARQFEKAPDFTVLFLPGEAFLSVAARHDPTLIEDGMKRGVIIATPTTLVALLRAVAHGWRQAQVEENARKISAEGQELYRRIVKLWEHLASMGNALRRAVDSFNDATGSLKRRLEPSARKLRELAAPSAEELPDLEPVDLMPHLPEPTDQDEPPQGEAGER